MAAHPDKDKWQKGELSQQAKQQQPAGAISLQFHVERFSAERGYSPSFHAASSDGSGATLAYFRVSVSRVGFDVKTAQIHVPHSFKKNHLGHNFRFDDYRDPELVTAIANNRLTVGQESWKHPTRYENPNPFCLFSSEKIANKGDTALTNAELDALESKLNGMLSDPAALAKFQRIVAEKGISPLEGFKIILAGDILIRTVQPSQPQRSDCPEQEDLAEETPGPQ